MQESGELQLIRKMEKNDRIIRSHYERLRQNYGNQYVAIDNGKVVGHNSTLSGLMAALKAKNTELTTVLVQFIPRKGTDILY
ncbi:MAG: hypothetical protein KGH98_05140 [Candidatus Micrarchaeota archaeon]|nr:hypothetical protein [Candidatus Micrarchaeota archaeon]